MTPLDPTTPLLFLNTPDRLVRVRCEADSENITLEVYSHDGAPPTMVTHPRALWQDAVRAAATFYQQRQALPLRPLPVVLANTNWHCVCLLLDALYDTASLETFLGGRAQTMLTLDLATWARLGTILATDEAPAPLDEAQEVEALLREIAWRDTLRQGREEASDGDEA